KFFVRQDMVSDSRKILVLVPRFDRQTKGRRQWSNRLYRTVTHLAMLRCNEYVRNPKTHRRNRRFDAILNTQKLVSIAGQFRRARTSRWCKQERKRACARESPHREMRAIVVIRLFCVANQQYLLRWHRASASGEYD